MEQKICQSCGMPLGDPDMKGTHADGSKNEDYCIYCYRDGAFTSECTMEQMIDHCARFVDDFNRDSGLQLSEAEAVEKMKLYFPTLKRWADRK